MVPPPPPSATEPPDAADEQARADSARVMRVAANAAALPRLCAGAAVVSLAGGAALRWASGHDLAGGAAPIVVSIAAGFVAVQLGRRCRGLAEPLDATACRTRRAARALMPVALWAWVVAIGVGATQVTGQFPESWSATMGVVVGVLDRLAALTAAAGWAAMALLADRLVRRAGAPSTGWPGLAAAAGFAAGKVLAPAPLLVWVAAPATGPLAGVALVALSAGLGVASTLGLRRRLDGESDRLMQAYALGSRPRRDPRTCGDAAQCVPLRARLPMSIAISSACS